MEVVVDKKLKRREAILNGNLWKTILIVSLPILIYNLCNYLYGIYDMMVVQSAGIGEAADIVVLDQIKNMISTIGGAIATGGGILVSRRYGENKISEAKRCANCLFSIALIVMGLTLLFIPIGVPFLKLLRTDQSTIDNAMGYYYIQIVILALTTINNTFIALEKSKGNTVKLFVLNFGVIFIKIGLSTLFAFGPFEGVTVTWLAGATLAAQSFLFIAGLIYLFLPGNVLRISFKALNFNKSDTLNIIKLSLPVFVGRFLFSFGKVYINSIAIDAYGKTCVGALGISNTMAGLLTNMINSFEDGGSTIVSQNYGNKNGRRIRRFFIINMIYLVSMATIGMLTCFFLKEQIAEFFAPNDPLYQEMIVNIFKWECVDLIFTGIQAVGLSIFYGFGKTRITMALSMAQLFAFRIPTLLLGIYVFKINYEACGIAMFTSNAITGTLAFVFALIFIIRMDKSDKYKDLFTKQTDNPNQLQPSL